jgi:transposase
MDRTRRFRHDGHSAAGSRIAGRTEDPVMSISHGPIDLALAALLSLLLATIALSNAIA